jgi:hypothetical protein
MAADLLACPDLDGISLVLEKIECLVRLALGDGESQGKHLLVVLAMIGDYVGELRQLTTALSERGACR